MPHPVTLRRAGAAPVAALLLALAAGAAPGLRAEEAGAPPADTASSARPAPFDPQRTLTRHTLALADGDLAYTAVAEFLPLHDPARDAPAARVFTTTYTLDGPDRGTDRPVAFVFNGGPGAASAYLHMGALGPRIVRFADDGTLVRPPAPVDDNPHTWLRFTDLVFIDPVGTGFSRGLGRDDGAESRYWNIDADVESLTEIVRLWLARHGRWQSPKLLVGESYGGFRIARLARSLFEGPGIAVNGLVMVSPVVDFGSIGDDEADLLGWALRLPSMAASAAAHGRTAGTPAEAAARAEAFALGDYVSGLAGLDLGEPERSASLFRATADLIGLPAELVERRRAMVPIGVFAREILRSQGRVVSIYDGTFVGPDPDPASPRIALDPFLTGTVPTYSTAFTGYIQRELELRTDVPFRLLSREVSRRWEWPRRSVPSALDDLQSVLALTPGLRVMMAHGRTDLITPYMASRWVAARLELPPGERDRVTVPVYDGGHMMYTLPDSRRRLFEDARAMVEAALR
ncbi:S10 family peptidase [Azospirillum halopraeferens]|uniref:S10 family peptidase n=1 Tax=Azospirillum halopraeferens TaxID=34010 RepID=UPI000424FB2E|nr:septum formation initiator [Azospirillum halopraeferens]